MLSLTWMRSAWKVRVAGSMPSRERGRTRRTILASCAVRVTGAVRRAAARRAGREGLFRSVGVDALELFTDRPYDASLVRFFQRRARRLQR